MKRLPHQFQDVKHCWPGDEAMGNVLHTGRSVFFPLNTDENPADGGRPLLSRPAAAGPNGRTGSTQRLWGWGGPWAALLVMIPSSTTLPWVPRLFYHENSLSAGSPFCLHSEEFTVWLLIKCSITFSQQSLRAARNLLTAPFFLFFNLLDFIIVF